MNVWLKISAHLKENLSKNLSSTVALAEWLRRVPAKYMGFPRESSNLSGDEIYFCSGLGSAGKTASENDGPKLTLIC